MHLAALVESPEHVCCRYRLAAFRPLLAQAGHELELHSLPSTLWGWFQVDRLLRGAEAVIVQRKLLAPWQLFLLKRKSRPLLFDFDDAVFQRDSYDSKGERSARRRARFCKTSRTCDAVVAGNSHLAAETKRWNPEALVHLIPTCVEPSQYSLAEHVRAEKGIDLVWIGSSSTLRGLEMIGSLLNGLGRDRPGLRLKLVCDRFLRLPDLPVVERPWSESAEAQELAQSDIGISWMPDDFWSRGKCGLKVLQYMAAGLPVVANPVGVQAEMIQHGKTGYLAETPEQWNEAVGRLAQDPDLRRRMGLAGRRRVEEQYSVQTGAALWIDLLDGLERSKQPASTLATFPENITPHKERQASWR